MEQKHAYMLVGFVWVIIVSLVFVFYKNFFPPLDQDFEKYIYHETVDTQQNAYLDFAAFFAPEDRDAHKFGHTMLLQSEEQFTDSDDYSWAGKNDPQIVIDNAENYIRFKQDKNINFYCHIFQPIYHQTPEGKTCPDESGVMKLIAENQTLLNRFQDMLRYRRFYEEPRLIRVNFYEWDFQQSALLYDLYLIQLAKTGQDDQALKLWIQKQEFLNRVMADEQGQQIKVQFADIIRWSIESLSVLLKHCSQESVALNRDGIDKALSQEFFGQDGMNVDAMMRADYYYLSEEFSMQRTSLWWLDLWMKFNNNLMKNAYLDMTKDIIKLTNFDHMHNSIKYHQFRDKLNRKWRVPHGFWPTLKAVLFDYGRFVMSSYYIDADIFSTFTYRMISVADMRVMKIYVAAKAESIPPENMGEFMKANAETFRDPFTGADYLWDPNDSTIYFILDNRLNTKKKITYP